MTDENLKALVEEKNRLVRENWQLRADCEACEEENDRYLGEIGKLTVELDAIRKRVHDAYIRDPGDGNPNTETGDPLLDRLLGIYTVPVNGWAGPLNGSDTFTRKFPPLPINVEAATEIKRLREALTWAVGFIRCAMPKTSEQYQDMRNAESLIGPGKAIITGEFQLQSARTEVAEDENKRLRDLVSHCWVHSGYQDCGSNQMPSAMRELYRSITEADVD